MGLLRVEQPAGSLPGADDTVLLSSGDAGELVLSIAADRVSNAPNCLNGLGGVEQAGFVDT